MADPHNLWLAAGLRRSLYPYIRTPWVRHSIFWGEWGWERWQNSLRRTVAELLRSGNY